MFDECRLNVLGDMVRLTPSLAKMNTCIPAESKSINVPPTHSRAVWFFSSDGAQLSLIKQLPNRLSPPIPLPHQSFFIFLDPFLDKLEVELIHFTPGLFREVTQVA